MEVKLEISDLKILEDFFSGLSSIDQKKIFMSGYRRAAKPLIRSLKNIVPYRSGRLYRSIGTEERENDIAILVGAKLSGIPKNKGWHAHFTENGTKDRIRKKSGGKTGQTPAIHWFENTYDKKEDEVYDNIASAWYEEIDKFISKINKRSKK
jgi:hypothetical protein